MKKQILLYFLLGLLILLPAGTVTACASAITVGSKSFTESKTVSEIYALALEKQGYKVRRLPNISNSVIFPATQKGQVDVYPDYTGTIVETYLHKHGTGKSAQQMAKIAQEGLKKKGLVTLNYAPGDNRQGLAMPKKVAKKYHITNLTQLQKQAPKLRLASQGEFEKRSDALPAMNKVYGKFKFKSIKDYDSSLLYRIMEQDKADVAPVSTTDGQLATGKFTLIQDDKNIWPPYNLVPVANQKAVKTHPKMVAALNEVDQKLTTAQLKKLNKEVAVDGQNYKTVAKTWFKQNIG